MKNARHRNPSKRRGDKLPEVIRLGPPPGTAPASRQTKRQARRAAAKAERRSVPLPARPSVSATVQMPAPPEFIQPEAITPPLPVDVPVIATTTIVTPEREPTVARAEPAPAIVVEHAPLTPTRDTPVDVTPLARRQALAVRQSGPLAVFTRWMRGITGKRRPAGDAAQQVMALRREVAALHHAVERLASQIG